MIQAIHASSHGTYGAPRIHAELGAQGVRVGRKRVARLMRSVALAGVSRRKRPHTTVRSRGTAKAPDLVQRQFTAEAPDRLWVADITYVPTRAGFLYLAVVVDVFSRRVVGWAMESHLRTELVLQALNMALYLRRPQGVIHHSDQGIQYTAYAFGKRCSEWGVRPSMGSVGDCYDNALCESFFASLECELLDRRSFQTHAEARMAVFQYIEGWYNTHRRHSSIDYYAPIAFERRYTSSIQHVEPLTVHQIGATPDLLSLYASDPQFVPESNLRFALSAALIASVYLGDAFSFALYAMASQPALYDRIRSEADALFDDGDPDGEDYTLDAMDVTHRFLMKCLRMYPIVPMSMRTVMNSCVVEDYELPVGSQIIIATTATHYMNDIFPDPFKFDIDRYKPPRNEHHSPGYAPFGLGTHTCLGSRWMELQLAINVLMVAHYFTLEVSPTDYKLKFNPLPSLKPSKKLNFRIAEQRREIRV